MGIQENQDAVADYYYSQIKSMIGHHPEAGEITIALRDGKYSSIVESINIWGVERALQEKLRGTPRITSSH